MFVPVTHPRTLHSPPCVEMRLLADFRFMSRTYNNDRILWGFSYLINARYYRFRRNFTILTYFNTKNHVDWDYAHRAGLTVPEGYIMPMFYVLFKEPTIVPAGATVMELLFDLE